jgi:aryl-alcohol dehydrogenase-like predicted oxidoreductase
MTPAETYDLNGRPIHRMGFGAMQLPGPGVWGPPADREAALAVLRRAVELGVDHIDTAQYYGPDVANELIREALHPYPDGLRLATKLGGRRDADRAWLPALRPEELRAGLEDNLRTLGVERMDLANLRLIEGPGVPFAESLGTLADLRDEGKIDLIGLSNVTLDDLRAGMALTEIAGVQNQYNVLERDDQPVLEACARHGLAYVPFFPLGSAFMGGPAKLAAHPVLQEVAARREATPAQVALAWLLEQGDHVLLIPGTSSVRHLEENVAAAGVELDAGDLAALDAIATPAAGRADR